ncbi:MAG TPA: hypothetical protein VMV65_04050 [Alphaproteobacteria bacterium]|nr:hypothetical protein [Alphaproteobacteria bacterium]
MRRHLAVFVLFASALLIAATPKPLASPAPKASPSASPSAQPANQPIVVVYPFEEPSDLDPRYGLAIAQIYSQVMVQSGGVSVLAIPKDIKREDYQKYAHVLHADYYISGYISPIGQSAAIVAQVVDVASDISVYSTTTQITDVQDVASQALNARTVILEAAGVERPELDTGPATSPTPQSTSGTSVSIGNVLGDLFKGKAKGKATAEPTATPIKPRRGAIVVRVAGNAPAATLTLATDDLYRAMDAHYATVMSSVVSGDLAKSADSICGKNRDNTIASGVLTATHVGGFRAHETYTFKFDVYACFGAVLYSDTENNDDYARAVKEAVEKYFADHPENNG